jgi:hypothetical protein
MRAVLQAMLVAAAIGSAVALLVGALARDQFARARKSETCQLEQGPVAQLRFAVMQLKDRVRRLEAGGATSTDKAPRVLAGERPEGTR